MSDSQFLIEIIDEILTSNPSDTQTDSLKEILTRIIKTPYSQQNETILCKIITQHPGLISRIKNPSTLLSAILIKYNITNISVISNLTPDTCWFALGKNAYAIKYISPQFQTLEMCKYAFAIDPKLIEFFAFQTMGICEAAFAHNHNLFKFTRFQTPSMCMSAIKNDISNITYVIDQTDDICEYVINTNANFAKYIKNPSEHILQLMVKTNGMLLEHIQNQTTDLIEIATKQNPMAVKFAQIFNTRIVELAIQSNQSNQSNYRTLKFIPDTFIT